MPINEWLTYDANLRINANLWMANEMGVGNGVYGSIFFWIRKILFPVETREMYFFKRALVFLY